MTVVGRGSNCNLTIDDALLSREQCAICVTDGRVTIRDLGSRNGTFVNCMRIEDDVDLHDGDRIRVGGTELVFCRVIRARRPLTVTTGSLSTCGACGAGYVATAACCPRCGVTPPRGPRRTESQRHRDFWLSLEVELISKAMDLFRLDEAEESILRMQTKLDELLAIGKKFDDATLDPALAAVVRFSLARGTGRKIGWVLDVLRRLDRVPGFELFAVIAETPTILLEEAGSSLDALIRHHAGRSLSESERSCLRSLDAIGRDIVAFGAKRTEDTVPRSGVADLAPPPA